MSQSLQYLIQHGPMLLAGSSFLLAVGTIAVFIQRSPVHRQRTGELTAMAVLVWLVLANLPLPRPSLEQWERLGWLVPTAGSPQTVEHGEFAPPNPGHSTPLIDPDITARNPARNLSSQNPSPAERTGDTEIVAMIEAESAATVPISRADAVLPEADAAVEQITAGQITAEQLAVGSPTMTPGESAGVLTPPTVSAPLHYGNWLATIFGAGAGVCILWLLLGRVLLSRVLRTSDRPDDWLRELYLTLPCRRRPDLLISQRASRAFSFGLVRPVIVLPQACCNADKIEQLRAVLLHELAHTEQGDAWDRLLFNAAFPLLYFHPLYWVIRRRTFMSAELIADDRAAAQTSRASYTQELIALVRSGGRVRLRTVREINVAQKAVIC